MPADTTSADRPSDGRSESLTAAVQYVIEHGIPITFEQASGIVSAALSRTPRPEQWACPRCLGTGDLATGGDCPACGSDMAARAPAQRGQEQGERDDLARLVRQSVSRHGVMPDRWHRVADDLTAAGFSRAHPAQAEAGISDDAMLKLWHKWSDALADNLTLREFRADILALSAASPPAPAGTVREWIACDERMPPDDTDVLLLRGKSQYIGQHRSDPQWSMSDGWWDGQIPLSKPSMWRQLPAPPSLSAAARKEGET